MMPSVQQLLIVLLIIIVLFGAKKIPDLAKGLGSGIKNFKKAVKEDEEEVTQNTKIEQDKTAATPGTQTETKPNETAKV
ncbi:twin-arginine translocase TatA/TatE family subunit [Helicobacter turcicus]|uniref:Sec-independent protein translocase protein TatA n=1 Tax=Helicobacter turcicus TaxID=2867412 RepID=A0ABS7JP65_9HELI|nr:twin-arginine translocase TatA/TatE family subunit [Helicobacter turcicus]MBX7491199.1 twin-arginine translocase TatA/TatE family subunit [Helicobacter turcicus]MBX7546066.1 twin-arginine translocase TatA/TatE family subunit [Helicobacter turcicus]